jgi:hypothetical protein
MLRRFARWGALGWVLAALAICGACSADDIPLIAVQVEPLCVELAPGGTQQFNARIFVNCVDQGINNAAVNWSVFGGNVNGTVDANGFYTAPTTNPPILDQVAVIATSIEDNQKQGQATVMLAGACPVVPIPPNPDPGNCGF